MTTVIHVQTRTRAPISLWVGFAIISVALLVAILAPLIAPYAQSAIVGSPYESPGSHLLGTDLVGRDLLSRLIYGTRLTIIVSLAATSIGFVIGVAIGFVAAELRGGVETAIIWFIDTLLSFPPLLLGLVIIAALGADLTLLIVTIAIVHVPRVARIARSIAANVASMQFVDAARARGEGLISIVWREILPNTLRPLAVEFGLRFSYAVLYASSLSFLGLGIQPPDADWGSMVRENMNALQVGVVMPILAPALCIGILAVGVNLVADRFAGEHSRKLPEELR
ncbi:ABC transporter permease [Mesorhizobium sp. M1329]|uniref:ABC transporter permease n=1 Tax=Mesorhizobium sp. M1329 TaxID=2957083 RepID=UPI0033386C25